MTSRTRVHAPRRRKRSTSSAIVQVGDTSRNNAESGFSDVNSQPRAAQSPQLLTGQLQRAVKYGHSFRTIIAHSSVQASQHPSQHSTHSKVNGFGGNFDTTSITRQRKKRRHSEDVFSSLQRNADGLGTTVASPSEKAIERSRGKGESLPDDVQSDMGSAFNADFGGVRVHTDSESNQLNESLSSRAFTTGNDIYFRQGEYHPHSKGGQELLAHELTHVVQQSGGGQVKRKSTLQRKGDDSTNPVMKVSSLPAASSEDGLTVGPAGDRYEQEADSVASEIVKQIHSPAQPQNQVTPPTASHPHHGAIATKRRPQAAHGQNNIVPMRRKASDEKHPSAQPPKSIRSIQRHPSTIQRDGHKASDARAGAKAGAKGQALGMVKTVLPLTATPGYVSDLKQLWKMSPEKVDAQYGDGKLGQSFRALDGLTQTADYVSTTATAIAFTTTLLGGILTIIPPASAAGAVFLGIGTVSGQVATIAHTVAFGLKAIQTIYQGIRKARSPKGSAAYAAAQAMIWKNVGGMVSNALGAAFGGLTGGLPGVSGVINPVAAPAQGASDAAIGIANASNSLANAEIGEGINRVADFAAESGGKVGERKAKRSEAKKPISTNLIEVQPAPTSASNTTTTPTLDPQSSVHLENLSTASQQQGQHAQQGKAEARETGSQFKSVDQETTNLAGSSSDIQGQSQKIDGDTDKALTLAKSGLKEGNASKISEPELIKADTKLKEAEAKEGLQSEPLQDNEPEAPSAAPKKTKQPGFFKRTVTKLFKRIINIRKRVKKVVNSVKEKIAKVLIKALGFEQPILAEQAHAREQITQTPMALQNYQGTETESTSVLKNIQQIKGKFGPDS
ncbi:MAG: DUF4157 domain-containing protein [Cyanobacteria bacterium P01_E01_bin.6]